MRRPNKRTKGLCVCVCARVLLAWSILANPPPPSFYRSLSVPFGPNMSQESSREASPKRVCPIGHPRFRKARESPVASQGGFTSALSNKKDKTQDRETELESQDLTNIVKDLSGEQKNAMNVRTRDQIKDNPPKKHNTVWW